MTGPASEPDELMLPLFAEVLSVGKRVVAERVQVKRETRTRDIPLDEVLEQNTVVVERVPIGRYVDTMPAIREIGDVTVFPVVEEVAVVMRRLLLREEVHVRKVTSSKRHVETVTVREQHAVVSRTPVEVSNGAHAAVSTISNPGQRFQKGFMHMTDETIVAVYDSAAHADAVIADLHAAKVPESAISRHADTGRTGMAPAATRETGFWASLFGGSSNDESVYDRSLDTGSSVVVVRTPEHDADAVMAILERHSPIDIDERAAGYGTTATAAGYGMDAAPGATTGIMATGTAAPTGASMGTAGASMGTAGASMGTAGASMGTAGVGTRAAGDGGVIGLAEESLNVGKRLVNRGGTRIRRYVVERPAEADVTLHSEDVRVERRPIDPGKPVTGADFTDKMIEMTATAEEAVVGKTARVVEEVALRRDVRDRTETVRDTVRRQEVEVEQIPGETNVTGSSTAPLGKPKI